MNPAPCPQVKIRSDYDPNTILTITRSPDGDVVLDIHGDGEFRIATDGGQFHGDTLVGICEAFKTIMSLAAENKG